jgi:hypothetical protein
MQLATMYTSWRTTLKLLLIQGLASPSCPNNLADTPVGDRDRSISNTSRVL